MPKKQHPWRCSYQVRIRKEYESRPSRNRPCIPSKKPIYTNRSRDHGCPPLTTVSNFMNADGGIGTAPSSTAAGSSLPSSKDYLRPRLRQTSPLHCTSTRSFQYPAGAPTVRALCPTCEDACTHTHEIGPTHKHTHTHRQQRAHAHTLQQKCTLARRTRGALTYETVGAATPWR